MTMREKKGRPAPCATSYMVGRENKRTNNRTMFPALKNNAAAGYKDPVKIELLKGAGPLEEKKILPTATGIQKENRMF